jgi:hypothetical protein
VEVLVKSLTLFGHVVFVAFFLALGAALVLSFRCPRLRLP